MSTRRDDPRRRERADVPDRGRRAPETRRWPCPGGCVADSEALCTDAEVLQEILHRYTSIDRRDKIEPAFDALLAVTDVVYPIELADIERARRIVLPTPRLSPRDALHVAVMQGRDIGRIMSFDRAFDGVPGIVRLAG